MTALEGPWTLRHVAANGARFRVAEVGTGPIVLFLHGFPEFWWAWRHQLPAIAAAGFHAVAMDLRGYGGSDKTPRGYDPVTLAADVAGVIRTLGARDAVVVGQGWGGYVGWAVAAGHPSCVRGLVAISAPHPVEMLRTPRLLRRAPLVHLAAMQLPWVPERRIMRGDYIARHLAAWSARGSAFPSAAEASQYRDALAQWPSPHCALEYHRWLVRSRLRADGRAFTTMMRARIGVPVLQLRGHADVVVSPRAVSGSKSHLDGPHTAVQIDAAGHFPHEEQPGAVTKALLQWLAGLSDGAVAGGDRLA
ncbi:MAG: alpha/beta fold hydrolase [Nocardioidaceae bacterium]